MRDRTPRTGPLGQQIKVLLVPKYYYIYKILTSFEINQVSLLVLACRKKSTCESIILTAVILIFNNTHRYVLQFASKNRVTPHEFLFFLLVMVTYEEPHSGKSK